MVAGNLWPGTDPGRAQGCLRTSLWRMQDVVPGLVSTEYDLLALEAAVRVDVREDRMFQPGGGPYAPELLPGWYDDWVLQERERFRQLSMRALEQLASEWIARGRLAEALEAALEAVRLEPLRESAHRVVIAAHLAEDNVGEALAHYTLLTRLLDADLGVRPSERTRAMLRARIPADRWPLILR